MNPSSSSIATIIPCLGNSEKTKRCLTSLIEDGAPNNHIFVIENGTVENVNLLKPLFPKVHFISLALNHGFAGGCNRGIQESIELLNPNFFFFLNNDATVEKGSVLKLLQILLKEPDCGAIGPKILNDGDKKYFWAAGGEWIKWRFMAKNRGQDKEDKGQFNQQDECKFLSACALMVPRKTIDHIGYFDEDFFTYIEDVDFSIRIQKNGLKLLYTPSAIVYHEGNSTSGSQYAPFQSFYRWRNRLLIISKHANPLHKVFLYFIFFPILFLRDTFSYLLKGKFKSYPRLWQGFFQFLSISLFKANPEPLRTI